MARPNKREIILDNAENIEKWASEGLTLKMIANKLGVAESTLYKYKAENSEITEAVKKGRPKAVEDIENSMFTAACGSKEMVKKHAKLKRIEYENGKKLREWEELVEYEELVYIPPDTTAAIFLLKNWGGYANEPVTNEIRKRELQLKEKQAENNLW